MKEKFEKCIPHFAASLALIVAAAAISHFMPSYAPALYFAAGMCEKKAAEKFKEYRKK